MDITISVTPSFEEVGLRFKGIDIRSFIDTQVYELSLMAEREAKKVTPVDTGRLRASIQQVAGRALGSIARVRTGTEYAMFVHEGTRFMPKRPFMEIGALRASQDWQGIIGPRLESYIKSKLH